MLTQFPPSNPAREDIHEQSDIDEALLEADVGNITHPDLIAATDFKGLQAIPPRLHIVSGPGRLTRTFDGNAKVGFFHQAGDAFIPNGVSFGHQQLRDTSIPVGWICRSSLLYFHSQALLRRVDFRLIIEVAPRETQRIRNLSN